MISTKIFLSITSTYISLSVINSINYNKNLIPLAHLFFQAHPNIKISITISYNPSYN